MNVFTEMEYFIKAETVDENRNTDCSHIFMVFTELLFCFAFFPESSIWCHFYLSPFYAAISMRQCYFFSIIRRGQPSLEIALKNPVGRLLTKSLKREKLMNITWKNLAYMSVKGVVVNPIFSFFPNFA